MFANNGPDSFESRPLATYSSNRLKDKNYKVLKGMVDLQNQRTVGLEETPRIT